LAGFLFLGLGQLKVPEHYFVIVTNKVLTSQAKKCS
jgi:hypothetical protein